VLSVMQNVRGFNDPRDATLPSVSAVDLTAAAKAPVLQHLTSKLRGMEVVLCPSCDGPLQTVLCCAMQLTAHMNASYQARDGLPPDLFPERVPVYLGHYHFPHQVAGTNITYIGSPYQGKQKGPLGTGLQSC
jgi:hypothetical protein